MRCSCHRSSSDSWLARPALLGILSICALGCDPQTDESAGELRAADESFPAEQLQNGPHELRFATQDLGDTVYGVLDTSELDPQAEIYTLFLETDGSPGRLAVSDEEGNIVAESEEYAVHEEDDDGGPPRYFTRIELASDLRAKFEVIAELDSDVLDARIWFCDQLVTNRANNGSGSLRRAVANVRDRGAVCFDPVEFADTSAGPIYLQHEIATTKNIAIYGTSTGRVHVTPNGQDRAFKFDGNTRLRRMRVSNGAADEGGLIRASGELELHDVDLEVGEADRGGCLFVESPGTAVLEDTTINGCRSAGSGGGAYLEGPATLIDSRVSYNVSDESGGGLFLLGDTTLSNTDVHSNEAHYDGGGMAVLDADLTLAANSTVSANHAHDGAGVFIDAPGHRASVYNASIYANGGRDLPPAHPNWPAHGGGVALLGGHLEIDAGVLPPGAPDVVSTNTSRYGGGVYTTGSASLHVRGDARLWGNVAAANGGGVYAFGPVELSERAQVVTNTAYADGGGLVIASTADLRNEVRVADNNARRSGGGVFMLYSSSAMTLWDSTVRIEHNAAASAGGSGTAGGVWTGGGLLSYLQHEGQIANNTPNDVYEP